MMWTLWILLKIAFYGFGFLFIGIVIWAFVKVAYDAKWSKKVVPQAGIRVEGEKSIR